MKKLSKIILTIFICFSVCLGMFACDKENPSSKIEEYNGIYVVKDGHTDYKLVVPDVLSSDLTLGLEQFKNILFEATGVRFESILYRDVKEDEKYISLGQNELFANSGITVNEELGLSGFEIKTLNDNIYIYGLNDTSTVYGMFELLTDMVGFDFIIEDYYINEDVKEIRLKDYNITDIPDIEIRVTNLDYITANSLKRLMLRTEGWSDKIMEVNGMSQHNVLWYVPLDTYYDEHPLWYAESKTQLSFTAHGNNDERNALIDTFVEVLKKEIINQPTKNYVKISGSDDMTYDESDAQKESNRIYGAESASAILFANEVVKKIQDWFETDEGKPHKREFKILIQAYFRTEEAPVALNPDTGKYEGVNGIKCAEGVGIDYAPINIDYTRSLFDPVNLPYVETMKKWAAICDDMFIWTYGTFAHEYFCPYDDYFYLQEMYQLERELGVKYSFNEVDDTGSAMETCFGNYRMYIEMKLAWDADADVKTLTKKFFDEYFGYVSQDMYKVFEDMRVYLAYLKDCKSGYSGVMNNQAYPLVEELWSKPYLLKQIEDYTNIINKLSNYYVKDSEDYMKYYKRIANERLSPLYMIIELYSYNTGIEEMLYYKNLFKDDCILIGGGRSNCNGGSYMDEKYIEWGVA